MEKNELLEKIEKLQPIISDHNKFIHLFSKDEGKKALAELNQLVRQIKFALNISKIKKTVHPKKKPLIPEDKTVYVSVAPCGKEFEGKTYLGFLIGHIALGSSISIEDDSIKCEWAGYNPLIYMPSTGKITYGCGSFWSRIEKPEDLKAITEDDINNVWYVKALKELQEKQP